MATTTASDKERQRMAGPVKAGEVVAGQPVFPDAGDNPRWRQWFAVQQTTRTSTWAQSNTE